MRLKAPTDGHPPSEQARGASPVKGLMRELSSLRAEMLRREAGAEAALRGLHETYRDSARNLIHYTALRRHDLREAQHRLAELGLTSLGGAASHVLQNLEASSGCYGVWKAPAVPPHTRRAMRSVLPKDTGCSWRTRALYSGRAVAACASW